MAELNELLGKTLKSVTKVDEEIHFELESGELYKLLHFPDCCESVTIDDICGDLNDLVGSPILMAEKVSNEEFEKEFENRFCHLSKWGSMKDKEGNSKPESYTWTFYKFATIKGYVNIRWFGESNGYYSESVDFIKSGENRWGY